MTNLTDNELAVLNAFGAHNDILSLAERSGRPVASAKSIINNLVKKELVDTDEEAGTLLLTPLGASTVAAANEGATLPADEAEPSADEQHAAEAAPIDYEDAKAVADSAVAPEAIVGYNVKALAAMLDIDARATRRHLRAIHGTLPAGVTGWHWATEDALNGEAEAVRARMKAEAK